MDGLRRLNVGVPSPGALPVSAVLLEPEEGVTERLAFVLSQPLGRPRRGALAGSAADGVGGLAEELARCGHRCLVMHGRRGGQKGKGKMNWTARGAEVDDCMRACEFLKQRLGARRVVLLGSSSAAPLAGTAAAQCSSCDASISIGYPFGKLMSMIWGAHYKRIVAAKVPRLFIMGANDEYTSVSQLERRVSKAKRVGGPCRMMVVANVGHHQMKQPVFDPVLASLILTWLTEMKLVGGVDVSGDDASSVGTSSPAASSFERRSLETNPED